VDSDARSKFTLKFNVAEYFLFYFLYYAVMEYARPGQLKKSISLLAYSLDEGKKSGLLSVPTVNNPSSATSKSSPLKTTINKIYQELVRRYLNYFLPHVVPKETRPKSPISSGYFQKSFWDVQEEGRRSSVVSQDATTLATQRRSNITSSSYVLLSLHSVKLINW
jgi:hypothetical protein